MVGFVCSQSCLENGEQLTAIINWGEPERAPH